MQVVYLKAIGADIDRDIIESQVYATSLDRYILDGLDYPITLYYMRGHLCQWMVEELVISDTQMVCNW